MRRPPRRWLLQGGLAVCMSLLLSLEVAAMSAANHAASTGPSAELRRPAAIEPIAMPDILVRADDDQQKLDWANRLLKSPDPVDHLTQQLADVARPIDEKTMMTSAGGLGSLPVMRLESLARHWQFDAKRLARWEGQARNAFAAYSQSALQLGQRRAVWSATRAEGLLDDLPPILSERVDAMLAQLDTTEAALGAALARQFALTQRASLLKARIQAGRDEVAAAIDGIDRRLLQVDVPPLWQGIGPSPNARAAKATMERGLAIESRFAVDYHTSGAGNQDLLRVVQVVLLPLIIWLFVRSRRKLHAATPEGIARALRRPFSAWLLLSMLTVLVLEQDAPLLTQEFALLVALVPVLRLLPARTLRALGFWPYAAIGLYALDRIGAAALFDVTWYRLFTLVLSCITLVLTIVLIARSLPKAILVQGLAKEALRGAGLVVAALLSVAVVCNVVGNISLASTLTSGVIGSGYMALLLYAAVVAASGILTALLEQPELANRRMLHQHAPALKTGGMRTFMLAAFVGWVLYSLEAFRVLRPAQSLGRTILGLGVEVGEVSLHIGDVLVFLLSAWVAVWVARGVRRLLRDELPSHSRLPRGAGNSIASLSYYAVLLAGLLVALSAAGFKVSQLTLIFGALGVGIGFGLQSVVNNLVCGLVLMFERPIQPGDVVEVAGTAGTVREIGLRATIIQTFDGADVVMPNGLLLSGSLTNRTMFDRARRLDVMIGVAYGSDPDRVIAVLNAAVRATPGVADEPEPVAMLAGYGASALNFQVLAWTRDLANFGRMRGALLARVLAALDGEGIEIPFDQMDVHVRTLPPQFDRCAAAPRPHSGSA